MLLLATTPDFDQADDELEKDEEALVSFWIGHCTFLLRATGLTVLTDPVWSLRLGPLGPKRLVPPACSIDALPKTIDAVILSSACYDHYDKNAVAALVSRVTVWLVPLGLKQVLVSAGVPDDKVIELDWWEESVVKGYTFICTPAQHYSIRDGALWCSWVVNAEHHHFFYCGGTGYRAIDSSVGDNGAYISRYSIRSNTAYPNCPAFQEINRRYGPCDTAFLPIGGSKPRVLMSGVQGDARDMVCVHRDLDAHRSVVHRWGTFACNDEGMLDAVRLLENVLARGPVPEREISYLRHGQMHVT
ncbi:unnamed protein product [Chondrus crispus]|uniref:Metallo-beta-lactamase domain-containing protein n=1 Tax=Chondrus crispus TaxID=2769 RepID=R7QD98_CHOCR|nr:unnamed protein product [Chondrus crispus]CDF35758.1 unnamed protein product [Chondrus crispus]|eukprot:XP_005715577.1 unnamed protein product [Chondrus crispus]